MHNLGVLRTFRGIRLLGMIPHPYPSVGVSTQVFSHLQGYM